MAYVLLRLESSAAAGNSFLSRAIFRTKNSLRANGYHRTMSSMNSKQLPRLILPPALEGGNKVDRFYNLANDRVEQGGGGGIRIKEKEVVVGCSHGWLALFNYINGDLSLSNPLTRQHIKLPPFHTLFDPGDKNRAFGVTKVTLSCSPDDEEEEEECRAVMAYCLGADVVINRLAFCFPGRSTHWTFIYKLDETMDEDCDDEELDEIIARGYGDIIYSAAHKLFFCITISNCFQIWNLQQQDTPRIVLSRWIGELTSPPELREILQRSVDKPEVRRQKYLVLDHRSNQLLLVRRHVMERVGHDGAYVKRVYLGYRRGWDDSYPYKTIAFDVHKVEWDIKCREINLTYMEGGSLNGLAIFIGKNDSCALSAKEYPGLIPSSIYFTDPRSGHVPIEKAGWGGEELPHPRWAERIYGGHDVGIFNYENKTFSPCYYPLDSQSIKKISPKPFWFTSSTH